MLSKTPIADRHEWVDNRPEWNGKSSPLGDMPTRAFKQAPLLMRFDVCGFTFEFSKRTGLSQNAAMIAVELWSEAVTIGRWTNYSRSDEFYARNDIRDSKYLTKRRVLGGNQELVDAKLIDDWRQAPFTFGEQSAMRARLKLVQIVQAIVDDGHKPYPHRPERSLILRDADGETIRFKATDETRRMARQMNTLNRGIRDSNISHGYGAFLTRIFNVDPAMNRGGRLYPAGGLYQLNNKEHRSLITIDGSPTVEYDLGCSHATILYRLAGLNPPVDAYDLDFWNRDLQKVALMILINAADEDQAVHSLSAKKAMAAHAVPGSEDALLAAAQLIGEMKIRHRPIASSFCSDAGAYVQKIEADIIVDAMLGMRRRGETTLPVHDSIIAREWAEDWLVIEMRAACDRAGLHGIRIEKVVPDASDPEEFQQGSSPYPIRLSCRNVMSYSFMSPSASPLPASTSVPAILDATIQDSIQPDSTRQNGFLVNPTAAAAEVLSLAQLADHATKTPEEPLTLQDETQPSSHAHSLDLADSGSHAMFKFDQKTIPNLPTTPVVKRQDDATGDSPTGGTDTNLVSKTPAKVSGFHPSSMFSQPAWTPKLFKSAAGIRPAGTDSMSMWNQAPVAIPVNAPEAAETIPMVIDATDDKQSIVEPTSASEGGSNLTLVAEESIQVAETVSEEAGNLNQVPVIHNVGDGNLTSESNEPILVAATSTAFEESILEATSTVSDSSNLNQRVPGIESESGDLLLRDDMDRTSGSKESNLPVLIAVQERSGQPISDDLSQMSSETKPSFSGGLSLVSVAVRPVSPATDPRFVFDNTPVVLITIPLSDEELTSNAALVERLTPAGREYSSIVTRHGDFAGRRLKSFEPALSRLDPGSRRLVEMAISPLTHDDPDVSDADGEALRAAAWKAIVMSYPVRQDFDDAARSEMQLRSYRADVGSLPEPKRREKGPRIPTFGRAATSPLSFEPVMKRKLSNFRR